MSLHKKMMEAAAGNAGGAGEYVDNLFSTYAYIGNGSTQTITNGIDLAGEGGATFIKARTVIESTGVYDTERGAPNRVRTDRLDPSAALTTGLTAFLSSGFTIGTNSEVNSSNQKYVSWTFRKAPKFFDIVTYTGDGTSPRAINHGLGVTPGMIIIKSLTSGNTDFWVWHNSLTASSGYALKLNSTAAEASDFQWFRDPPTDTTFSVGNAGDQFNANGGSYVAYLFAHNNNDGEFGQNADQDIIKCGSYTGNGSTNGPEINLGFEPQWILIKSTSLSTNWSMVDNIRGLVSNGSDKYLRPNESATEYSGSVITPTSIGFKMATTGSDFNANTQTYIYVAIRRPHKPAETGSEVFAVASRTGTTTEADFVSGFPVDFALAYRATAPNPNYAASRLTQGKELVTATTAAETTNAENAFDFMNGWNNAGQTNTAYYSAMFKRSPGFFDVVTYTGNGVAGRTVNHNLGVVPEMVIIKARTQAYAWDVSTNITASGYTQVLLNSSNAGGDVSPYTTGGAAFYQQPTESTLYINNFVGYNQSTVTYIAYLFASQAGISKVGGYTGNGTSQTIDCGFTTGARFVLIKRKDSTGDWHVWDTTRGIVAGNDPYLELNTTNAQVTTADSVDPVSSGFIVNQEASANINVNTATYIYLAIA